MSNASTVDIIGCFFSILCLSISTISKTSNTADSKEKIKTIKNTLLYYCDLICLITIATLCYLVTNQTNLTIFPVICSICIICSAVISKHILDSKYEKREENIIEKLVLPISLAFSFLLIGSYFI